jgi:hypothetical protein
MRECFAASPGVQAIRSNSDDVFLKLFLLHFCARGSQVTEPVRRAAERTNISTMNTSSSRGSRHAVVSDDGCIVLAIYEKLVRFLDNG